MSKQLFIVHDYLFERHYKISSDNETKEFFNKFFKNRVQFFEEMNIKYMNIAYYNNDAQSYSWEGFRYLIIVMVNIDECYPKFIFDLRELYQKEVLEFSKSYIDSKAYEFALSEYHRRKLDRTDFK